MNYAIVEKEDLSALLIDVNEYLTLGWIPIGGLSCIRQTVSGPIVFFQAVYKNNGVASPTLQLPVTRKRGRPRKNP